MSSRKKRTKTKRKKRSSKGFLKGTREWIKNNTILFSVILIGSGVAIGGFFLFFSIIDLTPSEEGYAVFNLFDGETGDEISGTITIININESDVEIETYDTGETAFIPEGSIAYVSSVTLITDPTRTFLPKHFTPLVSEDLNNPANNTIIVWFLLDRDDVTANITELNDSYGNFNESDIVEDVRHTFTVEINVSLRHTYSIYGDFSYLSDLALNSYPEQDSADLNIYGLWLAINGTELSGNVKVNDVITPFVYYQETQNFTMILLDAVFGTTYNNTIECELKDPAINLFVFQGVLDHVDSTFKVLGVKNY